jgi:16S rRNA (guanine527-N7)-methyltransferase
MSAREGFRVLKPDLALSANEQAAKERFVAEFNVSRETLDYFERYRALLIKWAAQINLVGPSTLSHFWERHMLDSAQVLPIAGQRINTVADFGTGAGLPGLVLARLLKDQNDASHVTLVEVSAKRCGFLREAARALDVSVTIVQEKIEDTKPFGVNIITARAFAPLEKLLGYSEPWMQLGARALFLKGEDVQHEIDQASTNWSFQSRVTQSLTDSRGCVLEIINLQRLKGN